MGLDPLPEPRVTLTIEETPTDFLVDTGAEFSVLTEPLEKLRNEKTIVFGATGQKPYSWTTDRKVDLRRSQVTHSFLIIPECPTPLLGRDLLSKLKAQISFSSEGTSISWQAPISIILALKLEEKYR
jgi:predicted aspartyl protease